MTARPSHRIIGIEVVALIGAVALAAWRAATGHADWDPAPLLILLTVAIAGDVTALESAANRVKISSSFLAIVTATVLLGETPAAVIGVVTILGGWALSRYAAHDLLINLVTYAWFPLIGGIAFHEILEAMGAGSDDSVYYALVFGLFVVALGINFVLIAGYSCYVERSRLWTKVQRALVPILPSELFTALLAVGVAYLYVQVGDAALVLFGVVLLVFQYLLGALLLSQQRGDELEVRARQLAGFQVAVLSALLRTLDLRDRMTARHSAAVARYAREIASAAGLSEQDQELAHTAGLLHDIGKFILSDRILKGDEKLTEADWEEIRRHPYEGARIVSEIDGYQPVGDIILAHHERADGLGYPRGLQGDQIPVISRILAVADTYDVMTARDSYRDPISSFEAIEELRRVAGSQLDQRCVEVFVRMLEQKELSYRHGEDADFEAELALDRRIREYVGIGETPARATLGLSRASSGSGAG
ncbi:MAG TPA: HD-GYP domain-containing protein [Solirubrobacterales bacterium]|nr:HD-GYP domain-containing protein [Solirubrobacterales bacterium]